MQIDMVVAGLTIDPVSNAPIVLLREKDSDRVLPIWIGVIEASAIAFELEKVPLTRPMAHDLLKSAIERLGGSVERVVIADLRDATYYATIMLRHGNQSTALDARPSDAIALALRAKAPIAVEGHVFEAALKQRAAADTDPDARARGKSVAQKDEDADRGEHGPQVIDAATCGPMNTLLDRLSPEAFGKYKM